MREKRLWGSHGAAPPSTGEGGREGERKKKKKTKRAAERKKDAIAASSSDAGMASPLKKETNPHQGVVVVVGWEPHTSCRTSCDGHSVSHDIGKAHVVFLLAVSSLSPPEGDEEGEVLSRRPCRRHYHPRMKHQPHQEHYYIMVVVREMERARRGHLLEHLEKRKRKDGERCARAVENRVLLRVHT